MYFKGVLWALKVKTLNIHLIFLKELSNNLKSILKLLIKNKKIFFDRHNSHMKF